MYFVNIYLVCDAPDERQALHRLLPQAVGDAFSQELEDDNWMTTMLEVLESLHDVGVL